MPPLRAPFPRRLGRSRSTTWPASSSRTAAARRSGISISRRAGTASRGQLADTRRARRIAANIAKLPALQAAVLNERHGRAALMRVIRALNLLGALLDAVARADVVPAFTVGPMGRCQPNRGPVVVAPPVVVALVSWYRHQLCCTGGVRCRYALPRLRRCVVL
jgi:hypothetical protein